MPYIEGVMKNEMQDSIDELSTFILTKGDLNYVICELVGRFILDDDLTYTKMSEKIDAVHDAEAELRRRILVPYEELKIDQHGDVPSFTKILELMKG